MLIKKSFKHFKLRLSLDIARRLDTQPARYGIRKTLLKTLAITEGMW